MTLRFLTLSIWESGAATADAGKTGISRQGRENLDLWTSELRYGDAGGFLILECRKAIQSGDRNPSAQ